MTNKNSQEGLYLFKPAQFLGHPTVFPPPAQGKLQASVQFIVPGLKLGNKDRKRVTQLAHNCGMELWAVDTQRVENKRTKEPATLFTFAFYVSPARSKDENGQVILSTSRLLVERFLGLMSFFAGIRLSFAHLQATTMGKEGHYVLTLPPVGRASTPPIRIDYPDDVTNIVPPDDVFSALFWLRRGLAERDPIDTFSSLMVCLQIMARHIVVRRGASITSLVRELVESRLGASPHLRRRLWRARNAVVAHGNLPVTAEVLLELTDLKFEAAILAFNSIKLSLGMPIDEPPLPDQRFFVTDAFMKLD